MFTYTKKSKEVSYEEYLNNTKDPFFNNGYFKQCNIGLLNGNGLMENIKILRSPEFQNNPDNFTYHKEYGKLQVVFMGGEETCKIIEQAFNNLSNGK